MGNIESTQEYQTPQEFLKEYKVRFLVSIQTFNFEAKKKFKEDF